VLSAMSDRQGKRVRFLVLTLGLAIPSLVGVAFVSTTWLLYLSSAALGFFIVGALPIGMQYAAEVTFPTPEGTSNGLVQLFGQCSVVFVYVMGVLRTGNGSFGVSLVLMCGLLAVSALVVARLRDPSAMDLPRQVGGTAGVAADTVPVGPDAPRPPAAIG